MMIVAHATVNMLLTLQNQHLVFVMQATDHRCHEMWRWHTEDMNHRAQCIQWLGMFLVVNSTGLKAVISSSKGACATTACVCSTPLTQLEVELSTINTHYQAWTCSLWTNSAFYGNEWNSTDAPAAIILCSEQH